MKCLNCGGPFVDRTKKIIQISKTKQIVLPKVCYNCGKPQASRQSLRNMKPVKK